MRVLHGKSYSYESKNAVSCLPALLATLATSSSCCEDAWRRVPSGRGSTTRPTRTFAC
ncbi:hypothetical protein PR003_g23759 [Phytophthora rubi]|uniref:Uncharacterized protein n=1 Tax=Phytophthora rubi TaxID=129364 RepID=A0A6A4CU38_9STRA|nr:hypothetical protein PR003_g23759 [Phytophthora rubi]